MEKLLPAWTCLGKFMLALWACSSGIVAKAKLPTKNGSRNLIGDRPNYKSP
jgi:hypothetical protein